MPLPATDKASRADIARIALTQDGVMEEGGNNCGPKIRMYQSATWLAPGPWPWCAAFVDWVIREWTHRFQPRGEPLYRGFTGEAWRPLTAGAQDLENWGRKRGLVILPPTADVEAGDIVVYDFGHCGFITEDRSRTAMTVLTIEGNTGAAGLRDAPTGDGVFQKKRDRALVRSFVRMELDPNWTPPTKAV